jgi:hypothetical protein
MRNVVTKAQIDEDMRSIIQGLREKLWMMKIVKNERIGINGLTQDY